VARAPGWLDRLSRQFIDGSRRAALIVCGGLWLGFWPQPGKAEVVDLELLLAIDTSISVSAGEFGLQVQGLAQAFQDPRVLAAIQAAGDLGIAVSVVQWANYNEQFIALDWTKVQGPEGALQLSQAIAGMPRRFIGYGTAITSALRFCARRFFGNGFEARRRIIDVSGDGSDNRGPMPDLMRDIATGAGITINGLAIRNEEPNLDFYYDRHVIGGTGAFVMTADDYHDFADAIVVKLVREISQAPMSEAPGDERWTLLRRANP
jgi:hypothetical protein